MKTARVLILGLSLAAAPLCHAQTEAAENALRGVGSAVKGFFGSITGAIGDVFDPKASELKALLKKGDFAAADEFYRANWFHLTDAKYEPLRKELAAGLNEQRRAAFEESLAKIRALGKPLRRAQEAEAKDVLESTRKVVEEARLIPVFREEKYRSPLFNELDNEFESLEKRLAFEPALADLSEIRLPVAVQDWGSTKQAIASAEAALKAAGDAPELQESRALVARLVASLEESAGAAFAQYDHRQDGLFFDQYPVTLSAEAQRKLINEHASSWQGALTAAAAQRDRVVSAYAGQLDEGAREGFVRVYTDALVRERGVREPLSAVDLLSVIEQVEKARLPAGELKKRLRVWVLTQPGAPARVAFAPEHTVQALGLGNLEAWAREIAEQKGPEIHLLIDPFRRNANNGVVDVSSQSREFVAGRRQEPNPEWESAQRELDRAQDELKTAEQQERATKEQMRELANSPLGNRSRMGAALGGGMVAWGANAARERVSEARRALSRTPRMVRKEVKESYNAPVARLELSKVEDVAIYVIEPASGRFAKTSLRKNVRDSADLVVGVHPADPGYASTQSANAAAQARLVGVAKQSSSVDGDEIWRDLRSRRPAADQPLAALAQTVMSDRKQWMDEAAQDTAQFRQRSAQADGRLKSALAQNQALFQRAASTRHADIEPEPYTRERTTGQGVVDAMYEVNEAMLNARQQQLQQQAAAQSQRQAEAAYVAQQNQAYRQQREAEDRQWLEQQRAQQARMQEESERAAQAQRQMQIAQAEQARGPSCSDRFPYGRKYGWAQTKPNLIRYCQCIGGTLFGPTRYKDGSESVACRGAESKHDNSDFGCGVDRHGDVQCGMK